MTVPGLTQRVVPQEGAYCISFYTVVGPSICIKYMQLCVLKIVINLYIMYMCCYSFVQTVL